MHPCVRLLLLCLVVSVCGANHALAYSRSDVPREAPESRPFTGQDEAAESVRPEPAVAPAPAPEPAPVSEASETEPAAGAA